MSEQLRARHFAVLLADRRHLDIDTFINYAEQKLEDYAKVVSVVVESRQSAAVKELVKRANKARDIWDKYARKIHGCVPHRDCGCDFCAFVTDIEIALAAFPKPEESPLSTAKE